MKVVGLDLSGPRNLADTCLVSFEEPGAGICLLEAHKGALQPSLFCARVAPAETRS